MDVIVEFDYSADEPDELTIKKGDIIKKVSHFEEGWFIGSLNGKVGVFPDNFVKIISKSTDPIAPQHPKPYPKNSNDTDQYKISMQSSNPKTTPDIAPLTISDNADLRASLKDKSEPLEFENTNKDQGKEQREPNPMPGSTEYLPHEQILQSQELVKTRFEYEPKQPDELHLHLNDIIVVLDKNLSDEGWWQGYNLNTKKAGLFPDNFVEALPQDEQNLLTKVKQEWNKPVSVRNNVPPKLAAKPVVNFSYPSNYSVSSTEPQKPSLTPKNAPNQPMANNTHSQTRVAGDIPVISSINQTRPVSLTTERPRQIGKRLPTQLGNATNQVPEFIKINDMSSGDVPAMAKSLPSGQAQSQLTLHFENGHAGHTGAGPHGDCFLTKRNSYHTTNNNLTCYSTKCIQQQIDQLQDQNNQLRADMIRIQKILTERIQSLMLELDELKKARAGDAVEIARLRQLVMQMDAKVLIGSDGRSGLTKSPSLQSRD